MADSNEDVVAAAFHPVEAAIVRKHLGLPLPPEEAAQEVCNRAGELPAGVVRLEDADGSKGDCGPDRAASGAVARLVLAGFEGTLHFWGRVREGEVTVTRKDCRPRKRAVRTLPLLLLKVNWADSGPGLTWTEAHHLSWLPGFNRWAVTASRHTSDIDGYCDRLRATHSHCADPVASGAGRDPELLAGPEGRVRPGALGAPVRGRAPERHRRRGDGRQLVARRGRGRRLTHDDRRPRGVRRPAQLPDTPRIRPDGGG